MMIIYVFRSYNVGSDYPLYLSMFNNPYLKFTRIESGYLFINNVAHVFNNFKVISIILFFILILGIYFLSQSFKINMFSIIAMYILTFLFFTTFNVIRQSYALGIIMISIYFLMNKGYKSKLLFFIIVILAQFFHNSAISCIPFIFLSKFRVTSKRIFIIFIISAICYQTNIITSLANNYIILFSDFYNKYGNSVNSFLIPEPNNVIKVIPAVIQFIFLYFYVKNNDRINDYKSKFILSGYCFYLFLFSGHSSGIINRFQLYYLIFPMLFFCLIFDKPNKGISYFSNVLLKYNVFVFCLVYTFIKLFTYSSGVVPYSF